MSDRSCPYRELDPEWLAAADRVICCGMIDGLKLLACFVVSLFRSEGRLEAEIVILRHQLNVLRRKMPSRTRLTLIDRLIFVWLYRLRPSVLKAVVIVKPETVVRWQREGFRLYWRWKSRARGGRPRVPRDLRDLIREMRLAIRCGARRAFMASCSSSASRSRSRQWRSTWGDVGDRRARAGRPFCATMPPASPRWICSWCRRSASASSMFWSSSAIIGDGSCRSVSPLIRQRSGSHDRSPMHFRGLTLHAT